MAHDRLTAETDTRIKFETIRGSDHAEVTERVAQWLETTHVDAIENVAVHRDETEHTLYLFYRDGGLGPRPTPAAVREVDDYLDQV